MNWRKTIFLAMAASLAGILAGPTAASAQTFNTYRCADGTQFIVGFYPHDTNAYMQIDGQPVTLARRPAFQGSRYTGRGVVLKLTRDGATMRHARHRATACQLA
ncbi:MliC family protein [Bradyrhizobium sp. NP1]|uniref:MliC family protein n=1 Tax=Bradyrhizobium sp. NP1 TaxID=3049772 RepID=UPI0025A5F498|nr:MliC family protein [Bradyrhizobium sp. NP1]WJR75241.1 MliC family protein [Bradyrhizobium sp. NP1]